MSSTPPPNDRFEAANVPEWHAGAVLTIDLDAVTANFHTLTDRLGGV
ncbi:MAG: hypothetical protein JKY68_00335, partial [Rhodospirillales bacterium]|nr:hypothetical protein [Rhodospirillales bacterium]